MVNGVWEIVGAYRIRPVSHTPGIAYARYRIRPVSHTPASGG